MYRFPISPRVALICVCIWTIMSSAIQAQQLTCHNNLSTSVGSACDLSLEPGHLIKGDYDLAALTVVYKKNGVLIDLANASNFLGQEIVFEVHDLSANNFCWGTITIEDKQAPEILCGPCSDPAISDPDCNLSCTTYNLFKEYNKITGVRGYDRQLLDKLIPSDPDAYINRYVTDNCDQEVEAFYNDVFLDSNVCEGNSTLIRTWTFRYRSAQDLVTENCVQYYGFEPLAFADAAGDPIIEEGDGTPRSGILLMPVQKVIIPSCNLGITPDAVAAYFDDPNTEDRDSNDDGEEEVDCVIENNEGVIYGYPHYYLPGIGSTDFHPQPLTNRICNINISYADVELDACGADCQGNVKVSRRWTILNWCDGQFFDYIQNIDVVDGVGPEILVDDILQSVDPWQCAADVIVPRPEHLRDNCDDKVQYTVRLLAHFNPISGNPVDGYIIQGVEPGIYTLQYIAEDCCGNVTRENVQLQVSDLTPPTPITIENIVVELTFTDLGGLGTAKIFASDIDNGSFDACSDVTIEVKRLSGGCNPQDTVWGDFVTFCCEDLKASEFVLVDVQFRVTDFVGNENLLWSTIRLEDKEGTALSCPPDMVLSCDMDFHLLDNTGGVPQLFTACGEVPILIDTLQVIEDTEPRRKRATDGNVPGYIGVDVPEYNPACGFGAIRKEFDQCTQWLVIEPLAEVFDPSTIVFPQDIRIDCTDTDMGEPTWQEAACNLVGVTLDSETYMVEDEVCAQVINNWTVIDWCNHNLTTGEGAYTFTQVVYIEDHTRPSVLVDVNQSYPVDTDCISEGVVLTALAHDAGLCASPWLNWQVEIDLYGDWIIDYTYSTSAPATLANGEPNPFRIEKTTSGQAQFITLPDGFEGSKTAHRILWTVDDACRNIEKKESYFFIEDQKAPTPYCLNVSTAVMNNGEVELWAIDFNRGSFDNCTDIDQLNFTFTDVAPPPRCDDEYDSTADLQWYDTTYWFYDASQVETNKQLCDVVGAGRYMDLEDYGGDVHRWEPGLHSSGKIFTTADIDPSTGEIHVPIYVWDGCENIDFCTVSLRVTDNGGGAQGLVAGVVTTESGQAVEGISTSLMTAMPGFPRSKTTDAQGSYIYSDNHLHMGYSLTGKSDRDYLNGISTLDLVLIQRHILGIESLDSPYKMIAADINADNKINGQDLIELRKLILGIYSELPQNQSWVVVDADQTLDLSAPWDYNRARVIRDLSTEMMDENFIGVKIGDVNDDVVANSYASTAIHQSQVRLGYTESVLLDGHSSELTFSLDRAVAGFQVALDFGQLEVLEVNGLDPQAFVLTDNTLLVSAMDSYTDGAELFTVVLSTDPNVDIDNQLSILSDQLAPETYDMQAEDIYRLSLFSPNSDALLTTYPNHPNPFNVYTFVKFELLADAEVTVSLFDVKGSLLEVIHSEGVAGMNMIKINRADLESGLVFCKVEANGHSQVQEMIIID